MFIPFGTDRLPQRRIIATPILIGLNLAVFVVVILLARFQVSSLEATLAFGHISRNDFTPWGLFTSQFLHDPTGLGHVGFNMLFLWVFGQAVESRLGAIGFTIFYLAGGVASGLAHMLASPAPAIGASGAVAAVSGAFLILFPRATIKVLLFFFIIGIYHIPALWFIGLYIAIDLFSQISELFGSNGRVAYAAHLGGYLFGAVVAVLLLATKILPRTDMDMLFLFKQSRRRKAMREAVSQSPGIWDSSSGKSSSAPARRKEFTPPPPDPNAQRKQEIVALLREHEGEQAINRYRVLRGEGLQVVLPEEQQIDLANRLLAQGDAQEAALAYQLLLEKRGERMTGAGVSSLQIQLLLASLFIRRLDRPDQARPLLEAMKDSQLNPAMTGLRDTLLEEIKDSP